MKIVLFLLLSYIALCVATEGNIEDEHPLEELLTNLWAVELTSTADPGQVAMDHGFINMGPVGDLPNIYLFHKHVTSSSKRYIPINSSPHPHLSSSPHVMWFENQVSRKRYVRWDPPTDPLYGNQWHLHGTPSSDVNVESAWKDGFTGRDVVVAVVDDGLQYTHPDISPNYNATGSYDFNERDNDPAPHAGDDHGTSAAGVAAASENDGVCGVGAAYNAQLSGIRLIAAFTTDALEAQGLSFRKDINHIYTNSWGPNDDGKRLEAPGRLTLAAMEGAVTTGRGGKGNIYVWAGGNGRNYGDNCNYDGYANSRFTIAIGAVDYQGKVTYYSESCSALLVCAPSSGTGRSITTTDLLGTAGSTNNDCTSSFGGTSSAAPLVAGIVALVLEANPNLGWRDVQHVFVNSSKKTDPSDSDWIVNGAGFHHNHKYGFGLVDAGAAVKYAQTHVNFPPVKTIALNAISPSQAILDFTPVSSEAIVTDNVFVETVEIVLNVQHPARGELQITLTSPCGTQSVLQEMHTDRTANINGWTYTTVRSWGESSAGQWKLTIEDKKAGNVGHWTSWQLTVYGH